MVQEESLVLLKLRFTRYRLLLLVVEQICCFFGCF